jgi:hypothetical protein
MLGEQLNRIATPLADSQHVSPVGGGLGHALLVVLVAVMALVALLVVLTYIEPRKQRAVVRHGRTTGLGRSSATPRRD